MERRGVELDYVRSRRNARSAPNVLSDSGGFLFGRIGLIMTISGTVALGLIILIVSMTVDEYGNYPGAATPP